MDIDIGDGAVGGELSVDDRPEIAMGTGDRSVESSSVAKNPLFPGDRIIREQFVNKFQQEAAVLEVKVFDAKAASILAGLNSIPSNYAFGTRQESSPVQKKALRRRSIALITVLGTLITYK
jgi:hypothetical protein